MVMNIRVSSSDNGFIWQVHWV